MTKKFSQSAYSVNNSDSFSPVNFVREVVLNFHKEFPYVDFVVNYESDPHLFLLIKENEAQFKNYFKKDPDTYVFPYLNL